MRRVQKSDAPTSDFSKQSTLFVNLHQSPTFHPSSDAKSAKEWRRPPDVVAMLVKRTFLLKLWGQTAAYMDSTICILNTWSTFFICYVLFHLIQWRFNHICTYLFSNMKFQKTFSIFCSFEFLDVGFIIHDSTYWVLATLFVSSSIYCSDKFLDAGFMIPLVWFWQLWFIYN